MDELKRPQQSQRGRSYLPGRGRIRDDQAVSRPEYRATTPRKPTAAQDVVPPSKAFIDSVKPVQKPKRSVSKARPALPRLHKSFVLKRHIVERASQHRQEVRRQYKRHLFSGTVGLVIILTLGVVGWAFRDFLPIIKSIPVPFISNSEQTKKPEIASTKPKSNLDQNKPTAGELEVYQAAVDAPRLLRIPKLDIEARVKRVGDSLSGEPISPSNIYDVGWYDDSAKPGQPGAMFVNGHVSGTSKEGVFHNLDTLEQGDEIEVERGDHSVVIYIVNKVQVYSGDQVDTSTILEPIIAYKNGLNLLTSTANYDGSASKSERRTIVFALQK